MSGHKYSRPAVVSVIGVLFLYFFVKNFWTFSEGSIAETQKIRRISKIVYPSVTVCPTFEPSKTWPTLYNYNLTKYFYSNLSAIEDHIMAINHEIAFDNGCVTGHYFTILCITFVS